MCRARSSGVAQLAHVARPGVAEELLAHASPAAGPRAPRPRRPPPAAGCPPCDRAAAGRLTVKTDSRKYRSSRKRPAWVSAQRSFLLAATMRASKATARDAPSRRNSRSSMRAQQLGLQVQRQVVDLVEEERAAVRALEAADALAHRAGEGALLVAEQLALDQRVATPRRSRRRRAGPSRAGRQLVDGLGGGALARCPSRPRAAGWSRWSAMRCSSAKICRIGTLRPTRSPSRSSDRGSDLHRGHLGAEAQLHVAHLEEGAGAQVGLAHLGAVEEGAVGGARGPARGTGRPGGATTQVVAADGGVVDDHVVVGRLADAQLLAGERVHGARALGVQQHQVELLCGEPVRLRPRADDGMQRNGAWGDGSHERRGF